MRLRALLPFRQCPTKSAARRTRLTCETLEGRELPAANLLGVNLSGVEDWSYDRMFADAMRSARRPSDVGSHLGTPPLDAKGWPAADCSIVVWHGIANMHGTYRLSLTGQADVSTYWGTATVSNKQYNAATNTTTATITYQPTDGSGLLLNLRNSRRTPGGLLNTGVTDIKLMRPVTPGSTTSYDPSVTFTQPLKDLVSKFSVVRMMDNTGSNGAAGLNGNWNARRPADYASQAAIGAAKGMAWEYAIQFWNETDTDAWVNIPFPADDAYITELATLLKNNLEPGRKLYVEYSNELWNSWGPFPANANYNAALAEVQSNPSSPLNFDGIYPTRDSSGWSLAVRRIALRAVQISNTFRQVFGDEQMMSRVRPVLMSHLEWTGGWLAQQLDFMEDYFNNPTYNTTPRPASYYLYGAGGSAYQDADWSKGANTTVDDVFNTMPKGFNQYLQDDLNWVAAFGLKRIAYEGGPSLDNLTSNQSVPNSVLQAAWGDPRMRTELVDNHATWSANGGDLLMYFATTGDFHWGLANDAFNQDTQKLRAIDDLNASPAAPVTFGKLAPLDLLTADFDVPQYQGTIADMRTDSLTHQWSGANFRVDAAGPFSIRLTGTASNGGRVEVYVDGQSVGTFDVPVGDTAVIPVGTLGASDHGIILRARVGTFAISKVSVLIGTPPPPPPPPPSNVPATPENFTATAVSPTSIRLAWIDRATNETSYLIERADDQFFQIGRIAVGLGPNETGYTDTTVAAGSTYWYRLVALNGLVASPIAGPASATTPGGVPAPAPAMGLHGTYFDNRDLTGMAVVRTDPVVDFYWPGSPVGGIAANTYSVRWMGQVHTVEGGSYQFRTYSDDGVRVWVNGKRVVNAWNDHAGRYDTSAAINLSAGTKYDLRVEFYNNLGGAVARLEWKRPGTGSFVTIPTSQLIALTGGPVLLADNFDSGLAAWSPQSGSWTSPSTVAYRGAGYAASGSAAERVSLAGFGNWADYSVAAWVNLKNLNGGLSVLGRVQDPKHYYQLAIYEDTNGQPAWSLSKRDGDLWTTLANGTINYAAGTWVRLRLTMIGNSIRAESSVDGSAFTVLGTGTDNRYTQGQVGLRSWGSTAYFDEVLVQSV